MDQEKVDKLLSIIVPVYNCESSIKDCIASITNSLSESYECICVDDGSTDHSGEILNGIAKVNSDIKVVHTENRGVSHARNIGISLAKGKYITFVDADDYLENDAYQLLLNKLKVEPSDILMFGMKKDINNHISDISFKKGDFCKCFINYPVYMHSVCNKIFSRELISNNKIIFDESLQVCEDMFFVIKSISFAKKITYFLKVSYVYRDNTNSKTNTISEIKIHENRELVLDKLEEFYQDNNLKNKWLKKYIKYRRILTNFDYLKMPELFDPEHYYENTEKGDIWLYHFNIKRMVLTFAARNRLYWINRMAMKTKNWSENQSRI